MISRIEELEEQANELLDMVDDSVSDLECTVILVTVMRKMMMIWVLEKILSKYYLVMGAVWLNSVLT